MVLENQRCYIEIDFSEKMDSKQISAKWKRYGELSENEFILVVCRTEKRMARLMQGAELVANWALFSTFAKLQTHNQEPWVDVSGERVCL